MELILSTIRGFMLAYGNIIIGAIFMEHMMKRKHSLKIWLTYSAIKTFVMDSVFWCFLYEELQTNANVQSVFLILLTVFSVLNFIVLFYTYCEKYVKVMIVAIIAEMLDVILANLLVILVNVVSGREIMAYYVPFRVVDILYPIAIVVIIPLVCKVLEPMFRRIRNMQIKHTKIWFCIVVIYILMAMHSNFVSYQQGILEMYVLATGVVLCVILGYIRVYHQKVMWEKEYLEKQQRLAKMQYSAITLQIEKMERAQKEINEQIQRILEMPEHKKKTTLIESYITGLKKQSDAITQGMYCASWFLDSVLCHQMLVSKERGIETRYQLQGYQKGTVREEDLAELVHYLLETYISDNTTKKVSLDMASLKGQLVIQLKGDGKNSCISKKKIRKYLKEYSFAMKQEYVNEITQVKITV